MERELTTIKLHGWLGKKYGKTFKLYVNNVREAVDLLSAQIKGFRQDIIKNSRCYRVLVQNEAKGPDELFDSATGKCIRIIPVVAGSGNVAKIIVGAILIYLAPYAAPEIAGAIGGMGWSLVIGGAMGLIFGTAKASTGESNSESKTSYLFSGTVNTTGQGNQVPLAYGGPIQIGSQVISAGVSTVTI